MGWKQLPLHTHDVDRQGFAQNSQMNRAELILKIAYWSAITLAAILKTRSARRLACFLLPAFLCAHIFIKRETCGYEAAVLQSKCGSKHMIWRHTPNQEITGKLTSLSNDVGMCRAGHTINATLAHRRSLELISFCCDILRRPTF